MNKKTFQIWVIQNSKNYQLIIKNPIRYNMNLLFLYLNYDDVGNKKKSLIHGDRIIGFTQS